MLYYICSTNCNISPWDRIATFFADGPFLQFSKAILLQPTTEDQRSSCFFFFRVFFFAVLCSKMASFYTEEDLYPPLSLK